ncbi:MAG: Uncharacterized protein FD135_2210, partial [Comamonadaceae bacterium]
MHILVVGAGIAGAATAHALVRAGCSVEILESADSVASEASHANAGLVSPGHCFSWAEPGVVGVAVQSLLGRGDGIGICPPWDASFLQWSALFAREASRERWLANSRAALVLAAYSRDLQMREASIPLEAYGGRHNGILYLYDDRHAPSSHDADLLSSSGEPFESLDAAQLLLCEPLLQASNIRFQQAVFCPNDGTGDAARYARAALDAALVQGAQIHFSETARKLITKGQRVIGLETHRGNYQADGVVIAGGLASRQLAASVGYSL